MRIKLTKTYNVKVVTVAHLVLVDVLLVGREAVDERAERLQREPAVLRAADTLNALRVIAVAAFCGEITVITI